MGAWAALIRRGAIASLAALGGCAPAPWRAQTIAAEYVEPLSAEAYDRERAIADDPTDPMAASSRLRISGVAEAAVRDSQVIILRCARSSIALSFSAAVLPQDLAAKPGDVLRIAVDDDGRAVATAVLTGPDYPAGQLNWQPGQAGPPPDPARYVNWRAQRWIVRCHPART